MKVTDTASFIARAKEIHGDKYDYSMSVFVTSQEPIEIGCKRCGQVFKMAQAESHYRAKKACGCRLCSIEESLAKKGRVKYCCACGCRLKYKGVRPYCDGCKAWWLWCRRAMGIVITEHKRWARKHGTPWDHWATSKQCLITNRKLHIKRGHIVRSLRLDWPSWCNAMVPKLRSEETAWQRKARNWARSLNERERMQAAKNCSR